MSLFYKEDWDQAVERYKAWWAHDAIGRCGLYVTAKRTTPLVDPDPGSSINWPTDADGKLVRPATPEEYWTNLDFISASCRRAFSRNFYGGEAVPLWDPGYPGHAGLSSFRGCKVDLDFRTGWTHPHPALAGESLDVSGLTVNTSHRFYKWQLDLLDRGLVECRGKAIVATGAFGGVGDSLADLRGSDRLLLDLVDRPDEVRRAEMLLIQQWIELFEVYYAKIGQQNKGSGGWYPLWAPGRFYATHNDFAYMISPKHFREIFLPALERQLCYLDYAIHHVDGVGNFVHVDMLCEIPFSAPPGRPKLQTLQILPGAGKPPPTHWMEVLKTVQRAGKNLYIDVEAGKVREALEELSARGLMIRTSVATEVEARQLLKDAERWSRDRC